MNAIIGFLTVRFLKDEIKFKYTFEPLKMNDLLDLFR